MFYRPPYATMRWKAGAAALAICLLLFKTAIAASDPLRNEGKLSHVKVVGSVFCDTCAEQQFTESSYFISGATVAVECRVDSPARWIRIEGKTNQYGEFQVKLPSSNFRSGGAESPKRCSVRLLPNPQGSCRKASIAKSSSLALKSKKGGIYTYSAGALSYRPQSPPSLCSKSKDVVSPSLETSKPNSYHKAESSIFPEFPPLFPPLFPSPPPPPPASAPPLFPIPPLPKIPSLPPIPFLTPSPPPPLFSIPPIPFLQPPPPSILPPGIPFLNPPPIFPFPPNPFQPSPLIPFPPLLPNPFSPPPLIPLPPNPLLPPPVIPLPPLPPNPFLPPPLIPFPPLIPPASTLPPSVSTKQHIP